MPSVPPTFRPSYIPSRAEQKREHDQRRGSASARGYTRAWQKASKGYLRNHPFCVGCDALGQVVPATVVDHIVPHKGDTRLFWDHDNWQGCCNWHHTTVKQQLEAMLAAGRIGPTDLRLDSAKAVEVAGGG
jgi:5-methylcytosine-specific restriction protein A